MALLAPGPALGQWGRYLTINDANAGLTIDQQGSGLILDLKDGGTSVLTVGQNGAVTLGTDLAVADGGTGVSTFALNGVLYGNGASAIGVTAIGAAGQMLRVGADPFVPAWSTSTFADTYAIGTILIASAANVVTGLAAGATTEILVGGGGAAPVWTTATGTGAPVRAGSPTFTTQITTPQIVAASALTLVPGTDVILSPTGSDVIIGTGEDGVTAATGMNVRAPDITTGGAGNLAGADLTIAAGLGTGTGDVGTLIFQLPMVAGAGDFIQTRATRLTLDMVASTAVLTMAAAQPMTISTASGNLTLNPAGGFVGVGGTPSVWDATRKGVQIIGTVSYFATSGVFAFASNAYFNGSNDIFYGTGYAGQLSYDPSVGIWTFGSTAASGTVGNTATIVERMRITPAGAISTLGASPSNISVAGAIVAGGGIAFTDVLNAWIDDATHGDGTTPIYIGNATIVVNGATTAALGIAGTSTGILTMSGATSGVVSVTVAAAAGTWTMTLPTAVGSAGQQLTDVAGDGVTAWAAAGSRREWKNPVGGEWAPLDPDLLLAEIVATPGIYPFHYKDGYGTHDYETQYIGVLADEAPWAMHYKGSIVNPVNTLGYMVGGFKALDARVAALEEENRRLRVLVGERP